MKLRKFFLSILIPFSFGISPVQYTTLSDINFGKVEYVDDILVFSPEKTRFNSGFLKREVRAAELYIWNFAKQNNLPLSKCRDIKYDIFVVDRSAINDASRYPEIRNQVNQVWGLYDPFPSNSGYTAIMLSENKNQEINSILLAHELSHYWFDAYCWSPHWNGNSESLALAFQSYYINERFGGRYE